MNSRGIYSAFTVSVLVHALLVATVILVARHSGMQPLPSPYIVSLVSEPSAPQAASDSGPAGSTKQNAVPEPEIRTKQPEQKMTAPDTAKQQKNVRREEERRVRDVIAALQAKKNVEKMAALRKVVEVGAQKPGAKGRGAGRQSAIGAQQSDGGSDYYSKIVDRIKEQWIFPESKDKDLEAVISIRIAADGSVTIDRIEKGSGNALFDRSVLRAVTKASPLPRPPREMEIGVRFRP